MDPLKFEIQAERDLKFPVAQWSEQDTIARETMRTVTVRLFFALVFTGLAGNSAVAGGLAGLTHGFDQTLPSVAPEASFIAASTPALAPMAHVLLCLKRPAECQATGPANAVVALTSEVRAELIQVNRTVNRQILPRHDKVGPTGDVWSVAPVKGDCEDYALTKRHMLIARGWPSSALRIAVARTAGGEGHAVLVVRTSEGDLVLDNRTTVLRSWNKTGLRWIKIQSAGNPKQWMSL